jgi:mono/diheme cytochrome c family protein
MFLSLINRVKFSNRRWLPLAISLLAIMFALGCYNSTTGDTNIGGAIHFKLPVLSETGSNRVQVFTEMHYQPSYRVQDVPRLLPPVGSVPITGAEVVLASLDEYKGLTRASDDATAGQRLYQVNCQVCHGLNLDGTGPAAQYMTTGPQPANLRNELTTSSTDGELFGLITCGGRFFCNTVLQGGESQSPMPEFRRLLSEEERWALVAYLRGQFQTQ